MGAYRGNRLKREVICPVEDAPDGREIEVKRKVFVELRVDLGEE